MNYYKVFYISYDKPCILYISFIDENEMLIRGKILLIEYTIINSLNKVGDISWFTRGYCSKVFDKDMINQLDKLMIFQ